MEYTQVSLGLWHLVCFVSIGSLFVLQEQVRQMVRSRKNQSQLSFGTLLLGCVALLSTAMILIRTPRSLLLAIPLAMFGSIYYVMMRTKCSLTTRSLAGFAALALAMPYTMLCTAPSVALSRLIGADMFATLFFLTSVFCVKIRLGEPQAIRNALAYHIISFLAVGILVGYTFVPSSAIIVLAIAMLRTGLVLLFRVAYRRIPIKMIGIQESLVAVAAIAATALF